MMNFLFDLFIGKTEEAHNTIVLGHDGHDFIFDGNVYHSSKKIPGSAFPGTAKRYKCRCGKMRFELTPAGLQQLSAGDDFDELIGARA